MCRSTNWWRWTSPAHPPTCWSGLQVLRKTTDCCRWAFRWTIPCTTPRGWRDRRCPTSISPECRGGKDRVTYDMVADLPLGSNVDVDVRVWYQAMPPRWVNPMFDVQDSTIQAFKALFEAQGAAPELVSELSLTIPVTSNVQETSLTAAGRLYPNPTIDGHVSVQVPSRLANGMWELYAPDGSRIAHGANEARLA